MKVIGNKILIKIEETTEVDGIMIPHTADESHPQIGVVELVGSGCDLPLKAGDKILFAKNMDYKIILGGQNKFIVDGEDVLVIL
jgi:co-chaperonin GroES (HSP10)